MTGVRLAIWLWQRIVSPHMAGLAVELAKNGCNVVFVVERLMSEERAAQGWAPPSLGAVRLEIAPNPEAVRALAAEAPGESIHLCQGLRANGLVSDAQRALASRGLRQWVIMETIDDAGWRGVLKRLEYRRLFARKMKSLEGVLANGYRTPEWIASRGFPSQRIFPFAYFLRDELTTICVERSGRFRFVFVGQLIERKRLDLLIDSLAAIGRDDVELAVVGTGPLEKELCARAEAALDGRVHWIGRLPAADVPGEIARADCLVLPSRHDGWGAVVSEALMVGTPAICSDACGAAAVIKASRHGGVFRAGDPESLGRVLRDALIKGRPRDVERRALADWAQCLGARAGARYLVALLESRLLDAPKPLPPWVQRQPARA